ncbi:hypothetical protein BDY21DRAFT_421178 [Lineolata rhizophorae]|uniref:Transcription initiation factor IIF subunit alpha n=1 Tax=Lineolata rhizophorae TaxID=578093 RepID=A0A6A6P1I6_9PEZI|nr:hypothetical protein BDY21DRAFT_421178 [Lineolata rhizophorae]
MSASPANQHHQPPPPPPPQQQQGRTPGGPPPPRRKPKTNPLVTKKPLRRPPAPRLGAAAGPANGQSPRPPPPAPAAAAAAAPTFTTVRTDEPPPDAQSFPLVMTKQSLLRELRHHVMRFQSPRHPVNLLDDGQFVKPVRLHRRDPRFREEKKDDEELTKEEKDAVEANEKKQAEREERRRLREENMKQVAPVLQKETKAGPQAGRNKKKTEQVYRTDDTPEAQKRSQLRYEETMPWHLEDFDGNNVWMGTYEAALSECHLALIMDNQERKFRIIPAEKWYRFSAKNKFKHMTIEEAEERMARKHKESRWFMNTQIALKKQAEEEKNKASSRRMFTRAGRYEEDNPLLGATGNDGERRDIAADIDDIDFQMEEDFQDDDENIFDADDEEAKEAQERVRRDQLGANVFDLGKEGDADKLDEMEKREEEQAKKLERSIRKALLKWEGDLNYEDSDRDPYSDSSDSEEGSEAERQKEEQRKKEEEQRKGSGAGVDSKSLKAAATAVSGDNKPPSSGASTKGTTTPSAAGKPPKPGDPARKPSAQSLKRPGSPNLSELSGNESARKKSKKLSAGADAATSASRAISPGSDAGERKSALARNATAGATSGSDSETPLAETKKKMQANKTSAAASATTTTATALPARVGSGASPSGTPGGSRAGSPAFGTSSNAPAGSVAGGSRAGSPIAGAPPRRAAGAGTPPLPQQLPLPTAEEIRAKIPPEGISVSGLLASFKGRAQKGPAAKAFTELVKSVTRYDKESKNLFVKE